MERKLQVFISSTYLDLITERQKVVQAVLDAGHIPAGMELFNAGDESQMNTIKKWIDDSDVYVLLLGKRYGAIEPNTKKSYTQLEYEYALEKKKPMFSLIVENPSGEGDETTMNEYKVFKDTILSRIVKFCDDIKDVMYNTVLSINEMERKYDSKLVGWSKGSNTKEVNKLLRENIKLSDRIKKLEKSIQSQNKKNEVKFGILTYKEVIEFLGKKVRLPEWMSSIGKDGDISIIELVSQTSHFLASGVSNAGTADKSEIFMYNYVAQELLSIGLAEVVKGPGQAKWQRIRLNKEGQKFIQHLNKTIISNKKKN